MDKLEEIKSLKEDLKALDANDAAATANLLAAMEALRKVTGEDTPTNTTEPTPLTPAPTPIIDSTPKAPTTVGTAEHFVALGKITKLRQELFDLRSAKPKKAEKAEHKTNLEAKEAEYKTAKIKFAQELVNSGKESEAREFLLGEVEVKRQFDIDQKPIGLKSKISRAIKWWDELGTEHKDKNGNDVKASEIKKLAKRIASISMIGGASVLGMSLVGGVGLTAVGTSAGLYLAQRIGVGAAIATAIDKMPEKWKKYGVPLLTVGTFAMTTFVKGDLFAGGVMAVGYGSSQIVQRAFSEKKIEDRLTEARGGGINLATLEADCAKLEEQYEKALKRAESTRIWRKGLGSATAIAASMVALEARGAWQSSHNPTVAPEHTPADQATSHGSAHSAEAAAPAGSLTDMIKKLGSPEHKIDFNNPLNLHHEVPVSHAPVPPSEMVNHGDAPATPETTHAINDYEIVHKGQGVEHAFIRDIENNPKLAQELGFTGDINDAKALHAYALHEAHVVATQTGYVDNAGHEVRITQADKVAYEIKVENGHPVVIEKTLDGKVIGEFKQGDEFGTNAQNPYEKVVNTAHHETTPALHTNEVKVEAAKADVLAKMEGTTPPVVDHTTPTPIHTETLAVEVKHNPEDILNNKQVAAPAPRISEPDKPGFYQGYNPPTNVAQNEAIANQYAQVHPYNQPLNPQNGEGTYRGYNQPGVSFGNQFASGLTEHGKIEVHSVHNENLHQLFPSLSTNDMEDVWKNIGGEHANKYLHMAPSEAPNESIAHVISYLKQLERVSGLSPKGGFILLKSAESLAHYEQRVLEYVEENSPERMKELILK